MDSIMGSVDYNKAQKREKVDLFLRTIGFYIVYVFNFIT